MCKSGVDDVHSFSEPILMEGSAEFRILKDKWTAVSADDKRYDGMQPKIHFPE